MPWSGGGGLLFCLAFLVWANSYVIEMNSYGHYWTPSQTKRHPTLSAGKVNCPVVVFNLPSTSQMSVSSAQTENQHASTQKLGEKANTNTHVSLCLLFIVLSLDWINPIKAVCFELGVPTEVVAIIAFAFLFYVIVGDLLNVIYFSIRIFFRVILSTVFSKIEIVGIENVPRKGPVIFTGNHANQFVDALQVICANPFKLSFLIAEKSWNRPVVGHLAKMVGCIPVARAQDAAKKGRGKVVSTAPAPAPAQAEGAGATTALTVRGDASARFHDEFKPGDKVTTHNDRVAVVRGKQPNVRIHTLTRPLDLMAASRGPAAARGRRRCVQGARRRVRHGAHDPDRMRRHRRARCRRRDGEQRRRVRRAAADRPEESLRQGLRRAHQGPVHWHLSRGASSSCCRCELEKAPMPESNARSLLRCTLPAPVVQFVTLARASGFRLPYSLSRTTRRSLAIDSDLLARRWSHRAVRTTARTCCRSKSAWR